ncbi:MAG TPA: GNAT family N-acetyltransferase [Actinomycetes bacterium]
MAVTLCVLLWVLPSQEGQLADYEDRVLARLDAYGARLLHRVRRTEPSGSPYEVQVIELPDENAYAGFVADPERLALAPLREGAVDRTEIIPVEVVPPPATESLPLLVGPHLTLRPGTGDDVPGLVALLREPSVARWWREPEPADEIAAKLRGVSYAVQLVIEVDGELAGGIEYLEENEPDYRHAGIDIFLGTRWQGRGLGAEAVGLLATYLIQERGHHRLTIDPAVANTAAIACYRKVGFRSVGVLRDYERDADGSYQDGLLMDLLAAELAPQDAWSVRPARPEHGAS